MIVNKCCQAENLRSENWMMNFRKIPFEYIYMQLHILFFLLLLFAKAFAFFFKFRSNLFLHFRLAALLDVSKCVGNIYLAGKDNLFDIRGNRFLWNVGKGEKY